MADFLFTFAAGFLSLAGASLAISHRHGCKNIFSWRIFFFTFAAGFWSSAGASLAINHRHGCKNIYSCPQSWKLSRSYHKIVWERSMTGSLEERIPSTGFQLLQARVARQRQHTRRSSVGQLQLNNQLDSNFIQQLISHDSEMQLRRV